MIFHRTLNLLNLLKNKSFFLFGPRATGKSYLIREQLKDSAIVFNLLNSKLFLQLSRNPHEIEALIEAQQGFHYIVIDEVQKIPELLDEVHRLIEERQWTFLLTGSSARKLKKTQTNLLAGRAWEARLHPLTTREIPNFDLAHYLQVGGLPVIYSSEMPDEELHAYVHTYLQEEIQQEAQVRNLAAFTRFLFFVAMTNGDILNFAKVSSDVGVSASTIREYYQILEDSFLGFMLPAFTHAQKRKAYSTGKFYLFDLGVCNTLAGVTALPEQSDLYGRAFEHFILLEIRAYLSYQRLRLPLTYWQSFSGHEVDVIIGNKIAIEIKSTTDIKERHFKNLQLFAEEQAVEHYLLISRDETPQKRDGILALHWKEFLDKLWKGEIV